MKDQAQTETLASVIDSLSALTANQAIIIELLYQGLSGLSEADRETVAKCASNNYEIAEALQKTKELVSGSQS